MQFRFEKLRLGDQRRTKRKSVWPLCTMCQLELILTFMLCWLQCVVRWQTDSLINSNDARLLSVHVS